MHIQHYMALGQNLVALVKIKIAAKWVFTPLTLIIIGVDTHPYSYAYMAMGQNRGTLVNIKIDGIYGCE